MPTSAILAALSEPRDEPSSPSDYRVYSLPIGGEGGANDHARNVRYLEKIMQEYWYPQQNHQPEPSVDLDISSDVVSDREHIPRSSKRSRPSHGPKTMRRQKCKNGEISSDSTPLLETITVAHLDAEKIGRKLQTLSREITQDNKGLCISCLRSAASACTGVHRTFHVRKDRPKKPTLSTDDDGVSVIHFPLKTACNVCFYESTKFATNDLLSWPMEGYQAIAAPPTL